MKIVRNLQNLTEEVMYCYGTSGELVRLDPHPLTEEDIQNLKEPEKGTFYIADDGTWLALFRKHRFHDKVLEPHLFGEGRRGEQLFRFSDIAGDEVKLITENIIVDIERYKNTRFQFASHIRP